MRNFSLSRHSLSLLLAALTHAPAFAQVEDQPIFQGRTLDQWIAASKHEDARTRSQAAFALSEIGPKAKPVLPALKELAEDADRDVRYSAVSALGRCGSDALPLFLELLDSDDVRSTAYAGFQQMGCEAVPELLVGLRSKD